jgi:hypothetical protein
MKTITASKVMMGCKEWGSKRLTELEMEIETYGIGALGYLPSPLERRVAVVLYQDARGWEGPPNTIRLHVTGADLNSRFEHRK